MTAFLFIPSIADTRPVRRVDLANIAQLFAEPDETRVPRRPSSVTTKLLASVLIVICALGDTVLIARPDCLDRCFLVGHQTVSAAIGKPASF